MICLDMDGVLVNFIQGALDAHGVQESCEQFYGDHLGEWDLAEIMGISLAEFWEPMGEDFWADLDWMEDGREILRAVEEQFGRKSVVLCTSPSDNPGCWHGKRRWIERHLPKYYHSTRSQMFGSQKHLMANSDTILVDDFDHNVDEFAATRGGLVCHVPRIWNRLHGQRHRSAEVVTEALLRHKIRST